MFNFQNLKIGLLGLGVENIALAKFLNKYGGKVTICDRRKREELTEWDEIKDLAMDFRLGKRYLSNLEDFDIVFRTPGLPYLNKNLQKAKEDGVEVSSQIKLFFDYCPSPIIGITGTKGKGTTTSLIGEILKESGKYRNVYIAGNIGLAPISFLEKLTPQDYVVLELSSFQLQDLYKSPHIAVVLDIKIDHLDYHKDEAEYILAKSNIVNFQTKRDLAVINFDYPKSFDFSLKSRGEVFWFSRRKEVPEGAWVEFGEEIFLKINGKKYPICKTREITLRGEHNLENICAAITASYLAKADFESIRKIVKEFPGLEHRLEFVKEKDGIKFYNDSFSTTPDTAIAAIKSFKEPIILIAGGSEKHADYTDLGETISNSTVKLAILIGKTGPRIKAKIKTTSGLSKVKIIDKCKDLGEVLKVVKKEAKYGDVVLLSPASASFDWFKNYKDRGNQFKDAVLRKFSDENYKDRGTRFKKAVEKI